MNFIIAVLLIIILIAVFLFTVSLRVKFVFDSVNEKTNITLFWLYPFLKAVVSVENTMPVLYVYMFNRKVYKGALKRKKHKTKSSDLIRLANPEDVNVNTYYGFRDPFMTGVTCGVINIASQFINIDSLRQFPDFMSDSDYIYIDATANVNVGSTLVNLYKNQNFGQEK